MKPMSNELFKATLAFGAFLSIFSAVPTFAGLQAAGFLDGSWIWTLIIIWAFMLVLYSMMHITGSEETSGPALGGYAVFLLIPVLLMLAQGFIMVLQMWSGMILLAWLFMLVSGSCLHIVWIQCKSARKQAF